MSYIERLAPENTVHFSRNPIPIRVFSDLHIGSAGAFLFNVLTFDYNASMTPDAILQFTSEAGTFNFQLVDGTPQFDNELTTFGPNPEVLSNWQDWLDLIVEQLNKSAEFSQHFTAQTLFLSPLPPFLSLTSKSTTITYVNLRVITAAPDTGFDIISFPGTEAEPAVTYKSKLELKLFFEHQLNSEVFDFKRNIESPLIENLGDDFNFEVDIAAYLNAFLEADFNEHLSENLPKINQFYQEHPDLYKRFQYDLRVALFNANSASNTIWKRTPQNLKQSAVYLGGLDHITHSLNKKFFFNVHKNFLTNQPRGKEISCNQPEFLFHLITKDLSIEPLSEAFLAIHFEYTDGSSADVEVDYALPKRNVVYSLNVSFDKSIKQYADASKTVYSYTVRVDDRQNRFRSESFTYYLVDGGFYDRFFFFRNSLGTWDTIRTTGLRKSFLEQKSTVYDLSPKSVYNALQPFAESIDDSSNEAFSVSAGYIETKAQLDWFKDFLFSKYYFEIEHNNIIPLVVIKKKSSLSEDDEFREFSFNYQYAFTNKNFSWLLKL